MNWIQVWVLPPLIGAIIGYFTNWLAIKMLFRPYEAKRVLGIKLPFTPGILPRERERLAQSLGDTVAQELLTPQVIKMRLQSPEIRSTAESAVHMALSGFLEQSAMSLFAGGSESSREYFEDEHSSSEGAAEGSKKLSFSAQVLHSIQQLTASEELQSSMRVILSEFMRRVGEMELGNLISRAKFAQSVLSVAESLAKRTTESSDEKIAARPALFLGAAIELPPDATIKALADAFIPKAYAIALPHIGAFLRGEEFKSRLEKEAHSFVKRALGRLGPMQRLFVSIAGYDAKIAQTMPETIEDLIDTIETILRDPMAPERLSEAICAVVIDQRARAHSADSPSPGQGEQECIWSSFPAIMQSLSGSQSELRQRAERVYDRLAGAQLRDILAMPISSDDLSSIVLSAFVRTISQAPGSASTLGALFVDVLKEASKGRTIAEFFGIGDKEIGQISGTLSSALLALIESRMPLLVEAIDIRSMVAERIDSLDMREVERIVLQVVKKELAWITWLGGILGAIIGAVQSLISIF